MLIGKPGSSLKLMVTASVICSASTPRPEPRIIATRGLKSAGMRARIISAAWNGELFDMEILCFYRVFIDALRAEGWPIEVVLEMVTLCIISYMYGKYHFSSAFIYITYKSGVL